MKRGKKAVSAEENKKRKRKKRKKRLSIFDKILIGILVVGVVVLLYPTVSNWWNSRTQTYAIATYDKTVSDMSDEENEELLEAAQAYNEMISEIGSLSALISTELVDEDYWDLLDIGGSGIMGYITIEKINVYLPIYHGTEDGVLQIGAGHLEGSSLPIGGEGTHAVISAHCGLPSALMFTNLEQLEIGDTFTITVLDQVLTYEVDQISVVLPDEIEDLYIEEDKDYCTLMTCTPYGVNSHRLLVRGVRTETTAQVRVTADANSITPILVAPFFAIPMLLLLLIGVIASPRRKTAPEESSENGEAGDTESKTESDSLTGREPL